MLIKDKEKYVGTLIALWNKVFGDDEEYIKLFFKEAYFDGECFAEISEEKVVSAFYLLKCSIKYQGKIYRGRYLYAAATLPEYRGLGLMGKLIKEAQDYIKSEGLDFIALVPAGDSLYDYYGKFGYKESMYKLRLGIDKESATMKAYGEITDPLEFHRIRSSADSDMLVYNDICNKYAFECLNYTGVRVFSLSEDAYYAQGEELFCSDKDTALKLINNLSGESVVYTNCDIGEAEKIRNGMIFSSDDNLFFNDIYMNIALD